MSETGFKHRNGLLVVTILVILSSILFLRQSEVIAQPDADYSAALLSLDYQHLISTHTETYSRNSVLGKKIVGILAVAAMADSVGDEKILSGYRFPDGSLIAPDDTVASIAAFRLKHGRFPADGLDLVIQRIKNQMSPDDFLQLSPDKQLAIVSGGLNWYTGEFYQAFDGSYEPGGIHVRELTEGEMSSMQFVDEPGVPLEYELALYFEIFGDEAGEVLIKDYNLSIAN
jgi:hypothetical protein